MAAIPVLGLAVLYALAGVGAGQGGADDCQGSTCAASPADSVSLLALQRSHGANASALRSEGVPKTCIYVNDILVTNNCGLAVNMVGFGGSNICKRAGSFAPGPGATCQRVAAGAKKVPLVDGSQANVQGGAATRLLWRFEWQDDGALNPGYKVNENDMLEVNVDLRGPRRQICVHAPQGSPKPSFSNYEGFSMSSRYTATEVGSTTPACADYGAWFDYKVATCDHPPCAKPSDYTLHCPPNAPHGTSHVCVGDTRACTSYPAPDERIQEVFKASKCPDGSAEPCEGLMVNYWCASPLRDPRNWQNPIQPPAGSWTQCAGKSIDMHLELCPSGDWPR